MTMPDPPTFDPRGWSSHGPASYPGPSTTGEAPGFKAVHRTVIAGAASVAILLTSLLAAHLDRRPPARAAAPVIEREIAPSSQESQLILNLGGSGSLESALLANRVPVEDARAASVAALGALGARQGEIRAVIYLDRAAGEFHLARLEVTFPDSSGAIVTRGAEGDYTAQTMAASLRPQIVVRRGEINDADFYSSAVAAGVTDSLIQTFAQAFVYDFNFQTEIAKGDVFEAAFEQDVNVNEQPVGPPRLLYASMTTSTKFRKLYRFQTGDGEYGWFDGNGRSVKRSFMRTPVDGARITSRFGMRFHPTLHYTRLHGGIDMAAPIGTPVYASAGGVVLAEGPSGGCNGNVVKLKHDNGWATHYLHLHQVAADIAVGQRVEQGSPLGGVGMTGNCVTGPHLHYEVVINGEKVDPETIPTEQGDALKGSELAAFIAERDRIDQAKSRYAR